MSEPTLRPIWTPADYDQTRRDAAKHRAYRGEAVEPDPTPLHAETRSAAEADGARWIPVDESRPLPFRRNPREECPSCWAYPLEQCGPNCLSQMSPEEQLLHRDAVLVATLDELDRIEALPDPAPADLIAPDVAEPYRAISCGAGRHRAEPVGMRPRRALLIGRLLIALAVLVLILTVGALWLVLA